MSELMLDPSQQHDRGYVSGNPLRYIDPLGLWTLQLGFGGNVGGGTGGSISAGIAFSYSVEHGFQIGGYASAGGGGHAGAGGGVGVDGTVSENDQISDIDGPTVTTGGSGPSPSVTVGGEVNIPSNPSVKTSYTFNLGFGLTAKGHTYVIYTGTETWYSSSDKSQEVEKDSCNKS